MSRSTPEVDEEAEPSDEAPGGAGTTEEGPKSRRKLTLILALSLVGVLVIAGGSWFVYDLSLRRTMPDLVDLNPVEAAAQLEALGLVVESELSSDAKRIIDVALTVVAEQSPKAGETVHTGSTVAIRIEPAEIVVPNVVGREYADARDELREAGEYTTTHALDESGPVKTWKVTGQTPAAGTKSRAGSSIALQIEVPQVVVPEIRRETRTDASRKLAEVRLEAEYVGEGRIVVSVEPEVGSETSPFTKVLVQTGAEVPNLVGVASATALRQLRDAGFTSVTLSLDSRLAVTAQSVPAGTIVPLDTPIELTVPQSGTIYRITGNGSQALVTWIPPGSFSIQQETSASLPWERYFPSSSGTAVFSAQIHDGDSIACTLIRDGRVVRELTSTGPYAIVQC